MKPAAIPAEGRRRVREAPLRSSATVALGGSLVALVVLLSCGGNNPQPSPDPPCEPSPGIKCTFTPATGGSEPSSGGLPEGEGGGGGDGGLGSDVSPFDGNLGGISGFDGNLGPPT